MRRLRSSSFAILGTFVLVLGVWSAAATAAPVTTAPGAGAGGSNPSAIVTSDGKAVAPSEVSPSSSGSVGTGKLSPKIIPPDGVVRTDPAADNRESVIGADSRTQVTNTTTYPYRAIVQIEFAQSAGNYICSGYLISKNTVATAGHCVYEVGHGFNSAASYTIYPGRNGALAPYGTCGATRLSTVSGWSTSGNPSYDYGAIRLNCNIGTTVGWFGRFSTTASQNGTASTVSGYPGDKPYGTAWQMSGPIVATESRRLFYDIDTAGGQSGAPVWTTLASGNPCVGVCAIAVHAYGVGGTTTHNSGTRITSDVFNDLTTWINAK